MIKQFDQLAHEADERRLKLEQMRLNIEKTKAETKNEKSGKNRVVIVNDKDTMRKAIGDGNQDN
nr:hypothetical protein P5643_01660 [Bacillus subtilis]